MRNAVLALLALLAGCADPQADTQSACKLEKRAELPVTFRRGVPVLALQLDGHPARMILDTGAAASLVTQESAGRMHLPADSTQMYLSAGIGGNSVGGGVRAQQLQLGEATLRNHLLVVSPFPLRGWGDPKLDGLLGNDVLQQFDVELDLPEARVTLYRARPCPDAVPPWQEPWTVLRPPAGAPERNLVYVPVQVDGQDLVGFLDSGAMATVVSTRSAHALGIAPSELADDQAIEIQGAAPNDAQARVHRFGSLRIGNDSGTAPALLVADLPADHGDMLVGVGYLRVRKLWISYATHTVFVGAVQALPP